MKINIKPLSVNALWKGRRFKTDLYTVYEQELFYKLPKLNLDPKAFYKLSITFGFSSKNSDLSNHIKAFEDVLQKKYGINDNRIYEIHLIKEIVKKGEEFIDFELEYKLKLKDYE